VHDGLMVRPPRGCFYLRQRLIGELAAKAWRHNGWANRFGSHLAYEVFSNPGDASKQTSLLYEFDGISRERQPGIS